MTEAPDLLEILLSGDEAALASARRRVRASKGGGDRGRVARVEREVAAAPAEAFTFDGDAYATLRATGQDFAAGRFEVRSIASLRESVAARGQDAGAVRLFVIESADVLTDIGALQAFAHEGTLFQAASQFNCLESPGPYVTDVARYLTDPTQGPRASISAYPATLLRHYAAPDGHGGRFVQSNDRQLDLLAAALPEWVGRVESGYLQTSRLLDLDAAAEALEDGFERIALGVHDGAEVVLGHDWDGAVEGAPRIAQVFTSTLAAGGYGGGERFEGAVARICTQLLRAAYLGTLLAAVSLGKRRVVLTMIGGGVFGNPHPLICECVVWAVEQVEGMGAGRLDVVLNGRQLDPSVGRAWLAAACERRGGALRLV